MINNVLDCARQFPRWKRESCDQCEPRETIDSKDYIHHFFTDISKVPNILHLQFTIGTMCDRLSGRLDRSAKRWEDKFKHLGDDKKMAKFEKNRDSLTFA